MKGKPSALERARVIRRLSRFDDADIDRMAAEAKDLGSRPDRLRAYDKDHNMATIWAHVQWRLWRDADLNGKVTLACDRIEREISTMTEDSPIAGGNFRAHYNRAKTHVDNNPGAMKLSLEILEFLKEHHRLGGGLRLPALTVFDARSVARYAPTRPKRRAVRKSV